jgi:hypothetical protein
MLEGGAVLAALGDACGCEADDPLRGLRQDRRLRCIRDAMEWVVCRRLKDADL